MKCDCDVFDANPTLQTDEAVQVCECGTDDEHAVSGECEVEL